METSKKIIWKKWIDPFRVNFNDLPDAESLDDLSPYEQMESEHYEKDSGEFGKPMKILSGSAGFLPLAEAAYPSSQFCLWVAHTNFPITDKVRFQLNHAIPGIEVLRVLTKYRFLIAVALAFKSDEVKNEIIKTLCASDELEIARLLAQECKSLNDDLPEDLNEKVLNCLEDNNKKYFMLYVTPNGHFNTFSASEATEQLYIKLEDFHITQRLVGGAIFTNFD